MRPRLPTLPETSELYRLHLAAARRFRDSFLEDPSPGPSRARGYWLERGFGYEVARRYGIGYCDGTSEELDAVDKLLGREKGGDSLQFRRRLMFPLFDHFGRVVGFAGRDISGDPLAAKYRNSIESPIFMKGALVYGLTTKTKNEIRQTRRAFVVEGYTDVVRLQEAGLLNTVGSMGTAFTRDQALVLSRYADEIVFVFDGDEAGQRAYERVTKVMGEAELPFRGITLPPGEDPDSYVQGHGSADPLVSALNGT